MSHEWSPEVYNLGAANLKRLKNHRCKKCGELKEVHPAPRGCISERNLKAFKFLLKLKRNHWKYFLDLKNFNFIEIEITSSCNMGLPVWVTCIGSMALYYNVLEKSILMIDSDNSLDKIKELFADTKSKEEIFLDSKVALYKFLIKSKFINKDEALKLLK